MTVEQGSPSAAGSPGREGLGAPGTPGAGAIQALQSPRGTKTGHAGQAGRGAHTFGPEGAWRDGLGKSGMREAGWEQWEQSGENLGYLDPRAGGRRTGGTVGHGLLQFLKTAVSQAFEMLLHANIQETAKLGVQH